MPIRNVDRIVFSNRHIDGVLHFFRKADMTAGEKTEDEEYSRKASQCSAHL
jgi:hypothetical protein